MLRHLRVTNFAILSDVELELGAGMTVLTGETGAGKSLIVEAVNLLRGGRASADIPRAGADEAVVEAIFEIPAELQARIDGVIDGAGLPRGEGGEVFIRRVIFRNAANVAVSERSGRSRTYVNGALTTAARLAELGGLLVDLAGQHQHQGLVDATRHLEILDAFGGEREALVAMEAAWAELAERDRELAALGGDEQAREARLDYLKFQLEELEGANLQRGEDVTAELERARLASVDTLQSAARAAEELLYGGDGAARDRVAAAAREVERGQRTDPTLEPVMRQLAEIETLIDDAADQLRSYADRLEGDPERLAVLDERIALIRRLVRKHGAAAGRAADGTASALDGVLDKAAELRAELDALAGRDARLAEVTVARGKAEAVALAAAAVLSQRRKKAARKLEKEVGGALAELAMGAAQLSVSIEPRHAPPLGATGADRVELLLASNKGEETRPLTKVASGGELSRIMLALKLALRRADEVATYVFDEVDAGIGGATAQVVGRQIRSVADHRQVLCVTHLPQIAAFADHHFHVEKAELDGRTETKVKKLTAAARKEELARMLGGHATSKAKAHAAELLADADRTRPRKPSAARV